MPIILKYIWISLMLCMPLWSMGQGKFMPKALRVGGDLSYLAISAYDSTAEKYELNVDVAVHRFLVALDYGIAHKNFTIEQLSHYSKGPYFRVGIDYNLLHKDPRRNALFFGLRYAWTNFSDELKGVRLDTYYGDQFIQLNETSKSAFWVEVAGGLKVNIWKGLFLGYTMRLKLFMQTKSGHDLETFYIPGYGKSEQNTPVSMNYYILYRIPLFKAKPIQPPLE